MSAEPKKDDLVGRLRDTDYRGAFQHLRDWRELDALHGEAAAEITRLRSLNAELADVIKNTRSIVSAGASVGFLPSEGDWATRLFDNQAELSRAISRATGGQ